MAQELYQLPDGWGWQELGNLCLNITDGTHESPKTVDAGFPYVTVRDISESGFIDTKNCKKISWEDYETLKKGNCSPPVNSVLLSKDGTVGKVALVHENYPEFVVLSSLAILSSDENKITPEFLKYFLLSPEFQDHAIKSKMGAAIKRIVLRTIKGFYMPFPSKEEQARIVNKLEALLSRIDQAVNTLKHSIELTDALFASSLNQAFNPLGAPLQVDGTYQLPDGWKWKALSEISDSKKSTLIPVAEEEYFYVGLEHIESNTGVLLRQEQTLGKEISSSKVTFKKGDVLYGKLRPYLNKVIVAERDGIATTEIIPFSPLKEILSGYLAAFMRSDFFVNWAMANCSGARMPRATTKFFNNIAQVPIVEAETQRKIIAQLNTLQTKTQASKAALTAKLEQLEQLKASLLDAAFRGEL